MNDLLLRNALLFGFGPNPPGHAARDRELLSAAEAVAAAEHVQ